MPKKGMDRRTFIKSTSASLVGVGLGAGLGGQPGQAREPEADLAGARRTHSICPYCAVGCGLVVLTEPKTGRIINIEGDPEHPINGGALCAKGASLYQLAVNTQRVTTVLHRAPREAQWREVSWDWAMDRVARLFKETRDASFRLVNDAGLTVNRTTAIAHVGSAALDNEECWALQALMRSMGLVNIEHQARI